MAQLAETVAGIEGCFLVSGTWPINCTDLRSFDKTNLEFVRLAGLIRVRYR